jgi:cell division protein FtsN
VLVLSGVAGVLTVTFVAGVWTGRHWPLLTGGAPPRATAEAGGGRRGPATERPRQAEPLPALTFYQELTAPLTAPPPAPRPARPARPPESRRGPESPSGPSRPASPAEAGATAGAPAPGVSFTVQVGAYNQRAPAEALRATLVAAGHDARVTEAATPAGVRYRVHVGAFPTREAARDTATRLGTERALPAFVTTR